MHWHLSCDMRVASTPSAGRMRRHRSSYQRWRSRCQAMVGIDLGTTHSAVSVLKDGAAQIIPSEGQNVLIQSLVCFQTASDQCCGGTVVDNIKRLMGKQFSEADALQKQLTYPIRQAADGTIEVVCENEERGLSPEQVSAEILKVLKRRAEEFLDAVVDTAVITVPSHFSMQQRLATMNAATMAGLGRVSLLQEPIAAAIAHGLGHAQQEEPAILVVDIGGGTCDISLLQSFEGILEVNAYDGDNCLGGVDMDFDILRWWMDTGALSPGVFGDPSSLRVGRKLAEKCKIHLSSEEVCCVDLPVGGNLSESISMTRADLQTALLPFLNKLWAPLERLGREHHLQFAHYPFDSVKPAQMDQLDRFAPPPRTVTQLLLVGGATKAPVVQQFLEKVTGCKQHHLDVDSEHCVAIGAAIHAGIMVGQVTDGVEMADSVYVQDLQSRTSGFQM